MLMPVLHICGYLQSWGMELCLYPQLHVFEARRDLWMRPYGLSLQQHSQYHMSEHSTYIAPILHVTLVRDAGSIPSFGSPHRQR